MWIFLMGGGIGSIASEPVPGVPYQRFIFPGIVIMSILFGSLFFGFYIIWDRKIDVLRAVLVAPVPRTAVFFGKTLGGCTDMMIQALLLMLVGIAIAGISPLAIPVGLLVAFLVAVSLVALGLAIGSMFESTEGFQVIVTFLAFPLFFLSGALYPVDSPGLPVWLKYLAAANPVTYAVDAMRWALLGFGAFPLALDLGALGAFTAAMVLLGTWAFSRMK
jgi:ABC-2 type transport system permease protein